MFTYAFLSFLWFVVKCVLILFITTKILKFFEPRVNAWAEKEFQKSIEEFSQKKANALLAFNNNNTDQVLHDQVESYDLGVRIFSYLLKHKDTVALIEGKIVLLLGNVLALIIFL